MIKHCFLTDLLFLFLLSVPLFGETKQFTVGILYENDVSECREKWIDLEIYLNTVKNRNYRILPLKQGEIDREIEKGKIDFLISDPLVFIDLEEKYSLKKLLTLKRRYQHGFLKFKSSLIFTKKNNNIKNIYDLKGKKIAAVNQHLLTGWLAGGLELKKHGLINGRDSVKVDFLESSINVIESVLEGYHDAGIIPSGEIEKVFTKYFPGIDDIFALVPEKHVKGNIPFLHSTDHYPEWLISKMLKTSSIASEILMSDLLDIKTDNIYSKILDHWGYVENYEPVRECMREMKYGKYESYGEIDIHVALKQYFYFFLIIIFLIFFILIILFFVFTLYKSNRSLLLENNLVISRSNIIILKINPKGEIKKSSRLLSYFGDSKNSNKRINFKDYLDEKNKSFFEESLKKAKNGTVTIITKVLFNSNWYSIDIHHVNKNIDLYNLVITNINKWMKFQTELDKRELMLDLFSEGIAVTDSSGNINYCNTMFTKMNQVEKKDIIGVNIDSIVTGNLKLVSIISRKEAEKSGWEGDIVINKTEKNCFTADLKIIPFFDINDESQQMIFVLKDKTDEIAANEIEREHIKLEYLNNLVAGISHEFNNYLMKITSLAQILMMKKEDLLINASKIAGEARKASIITDRLLTIAGSNTNSKIDEININTFIENTISDYNDKNSVKLKPVYIFSDKKLMIKCDINMLNMMITELYKNSLEAINVNGEIIILTEEVENKSRYHHNIKYNLQNRDYILISITDNGLGIAPEIIKKIIDPYFTTKQLGRGLGLSLIDNYLKRIGGKQVIESEPGKRTSILIFHPKD